MSIPKTCADCPLAFIAGNTGDSQAQCSAQHVGPTFKPGPDCPYGIIDELEAANKTLQELLEAKPFQNIRNSILGGATSGG